MKLEEDSGASGERAEGRRRPHRVGPPRPAHCWCGRRRGANRRRARVWLKGRHLDDFVAAEGVAGTVKHRDEHRVAVDSG